MPGTQAVDKKTPAFGVLLYVNKTQAYKQVHSCIFAKKI